MATSSLNLQFVNDTGLADSDVYITFQNPNPGFYVTYGSNVRVPFAAAGNLMSTSLSLAQIGSAGLTVTNVIGVVVYVSYGAALKSTTSAPSFIGSGGTDYLTPFQPFELTRMGGSGDQGNMTAINYFTAPMQITSYKGGAGGTQLQQVQYAQNAATIGGLLGPLTNNDPTAVIKNASNQVLRYLGPSSYGAGASPFPGFSAYLSAINKAGQSTIISNHNAFDAAKTNYNFTLDMTATVDSDGSIEMKGSITTTVTPDGKTSTAGPTFDDCSVKISAADQNLFNFAIYGQTVTGAVTFGRGWNKLGDYMTKAGLTGALATTQNLAIGEISTGLLTGFVNSSVVPAGQTKALKDLPSSTWWSLDPTIAFSQVQPDDTYYNTYANVIYNASGNLAYALPYSDRLGKGPLVDSVNHNGQVVDTWVVTLEAPVS